MTRNLHVHWIRSIKVREKSSQEPNEKFKTFENCFLL